MKALIPLCILLAASIFFSCNHRRTPAPITTATDTTVIIPETLEDERSEISFKRSFRENLVEKMYTELVEKKTELKKLEEQIELINQNDSLEAFHNFSDKSDHYYSSARTIALDIADSSIRKKAMDLIAASTEKYKHKVSSLDSLQQVIINKKKDISNLHEYLKIASTLPLMEKFQKDKLPSEKTLRDKIKSQDEVIGQLGIKN
jgi:hypothetical protein